MIDPQALDNTLARIRLEHWQQERTTLRCGRARNSTAPGRQTSPRPHQSL
jgi:hypothetical protein